MIPETFRKSATRRKLFATMEFLSERDPACPILKSDDGDREVVKRAVDRRRTILEHRAADEFKVYFREERAHVVSAVESGRDVDRALKSLEGDLGETYGSAWGNAARSWGGWVSGHLFRQKSRHFGGAQKAKAYDFGAPVDEWLRENAGKRITGITESSRKKIAAQIAAGTSAGETLAQIARRIDRFYLEDVIPNRSMVIARTEVGSATNWSQHQIAVDTGVHMEKEWLALNDDRTRDDHSEADGQVVDLDEPFEVGADLLMYPGDPAGGPEQVINCRCVPGSTAVSATTVLAATRRWYDGELVEVRTASGEKLAATPNHPVLGADGWVAVGSLHEGDYLFRCADPQRILGRDPHINRGPLLIEQVFDALALPRGHRERVRSLPVDFHGDGRGGEVDVVTPDPHLAPDRRTEIGEHLSEFCLAAASREVHVSHDAARERVVFEAKRVCLGPVSRENTSVTEHPPDGLTFDVKHLGDSHFRRAGFIHRNSRAGNPSVPAFEDIHSVPAGAHQDSDVEQPTFDGHGRRTNASADLLKPEARFIELTKVVEVKRYQFSGHVYNLHTRQGYYIAEGIISHNCSVLHHIVDESAPAKSAAPGAPTVDEFARQVVRVEGADVITALAFARGVFGERDDWVMARRQLMKRVYHLRRAEVGKYNPDESGKKSDIEGKGDSR